MLLANVQEVLEVTVHLNLLKSDYILILATNKRNANGHIVKPPLSVV